MDRLYALPANEFVAARDALAKRLRKEDREASDRVRALRRPEVHAWVVNQLWWDHREPFERLLAAGRALRGEGTRPDPIGEQREALRELLGAARRILEQAGHPVDPWFDRVRSLLYALASGVGTPGRASGDLGEPDLEAMFGAPPGVVSGARPAPRARPPKPAPPPKPPPPPPKPKPDLRLIRRRQQAEQRVRELADRLAAQRSALAEAEREAEEAARRAERARDEVEATRAVLAEAERDPVLATAD